ncbi:MAG: hypothetical protein C0179_03660 [Fervidicoccus sp.]|nr:MAG: hypothetical protein C0179_03660 [Fervidicoccus sp.]
MVEEQTQIQTQKEFSEFDEKKKIKYTIEYELNEEYDYELVKHLMIEKRYLPLWPTAGNYAKIVWKIDYSDPTTIRISIYEARESWFGTGSSGIAEIDANFFFEEDPWFLKAEELEEHIEKFGVKETAKDILDSLLDYFRDSLMLEKETLGLSEEEEK